MHDVVMGALVMGGGGLGGFVGAVMANKTNIEWLKQSVRELKREVAELRRLYYENKHT